MKVRAFILAASIILTAAAAFAQDAGDPLADVIRAVSQEDVQKEVVRFVEMGAPADAAPIDGVRVGSRVLGYPGNAEAAAYIEKRLKDLGYEPKVEEFLPQCQAPVPVDHGAEIEVPGVLDSPVRIYPLWPNLVRTGQLPRSGIRGHLIHAGRGTYRDLDGKAVTRMVDGKEVGCIALMDFNCDKYFINVRNMGAQAIVFIEPEDTVHGQAIDKLSTTPVNIPRYWMRRDDARRLMIAAIEKKQGSRLDEATAGDFDALTRKFAEVSAEGTVEAGARCRMTWERTDGKSAPSGKNIWTLIEGSDPVMKKDIVVVQAYYDSMSVVPTLAPGADGAGNIVGLLKLAEHLKAHPPKRSVVLLATGNHFVSWEGIADWALRHMPRGGTEVAAAGGQQGPGAMLWVQIASAALSVVLIVIIVVSTIRAAHWHRAGEAGEPGEGEFAPQRRAAGLASLRFVAIILLLPIALIALLTNLEKTFQYNTPEPVTFKTPWALRVPFLRLFSDNDVVYARIARDSRITFSFSIDVSSDSPRLGLFHTSPVLNDESYDIPGKTHYTYMAPFSKAFVSFAEQNRFQEKLGVQVIDGVDTKKQKPRDLVPVGAWLTDGTAIMRTGNPCLSFWTAEDRRRRVDTPLDLPARVDFNNLTGQIRAICAMVDFALNDPKVLVHEGSSIIQDRVKELRSRVVEANYRESFVADTPVVDALVVYRPSHWPPRHGASSMSAAGVRTYRIRLADEKGEAVNPLMQAMHTSMFYGQTTEVHAYKLSADDGRVIYAPDRGEQGDKSYPIKVTHSYPLAQHQLVLFRCEPLDIYEMNNARYLRAVSSGGATPPVVFDVNDATPSEYGFDMLLDQNIRTGAQENFGVLYVKAAPPGTLPNRVKFIWGSTVFGIEYLLTNSGYGSDEVKPEGIGFAAAPSHMVVRSGLNVARDFVAINNARIQRFQAYGVVKKAKETKKKTGEEIGTETATEAEKEAAAEAEKKKEKETDWLVLLHDRSVKHLKLAEAARLKSRFYDYRRHLDKARGFEARAYPDVRGTANDTVKGFIFYCVLLLPFAFFCERLFFGFPDIRKQLFGFAGFFLAIFAVMAVVHPVFRITDAPYVILLAFVILVLASSVLVIIISKFNEQMAKMRRQAAKVHEADVGRLSATGAAIMLGISNMKKRKVRTTLTTLTLILLTFTVMSFTSVKKETRYNQIPQTHEAAYEGVLLRDLTWFAVEQEALDQFRREFQPKGQVIPRCWMSASDPNIAANLNFRVYVKGTDRVGDCQGLVGMVPEESRALDLSRFLVAGRWFQSSREPSIILPSRLAYDVLKLTADQVNAGEAAVRTWGTELKVVGVLDSSRIDRLHDLDDELYTPLDLTGTTKDIFAQSQTAGQYSQNIVEIMKLNHLAADAVGVVPYDVCMDLGGRIVSAAVVYPEGTDFEPEVKDFLERVGMTVFLGRDGRVEAYSSIALSSVGDVGNLFVPILIAALIVLNTMMGSVHERAHEIGIYSSVGLAPVHIAALFLAESCVYAVMGAISGYLLGTVVGKIVAVFGIPGLTLNYSSLSAVFSTMVVMATVLLSTLYPAKMAANMSVPDVTRQWKFPDPQGDVWQFDFPFTVASEGVLGLFVFLDNYFEGYKEASIGSFYADNVKLYTVEDTYGTGYVVELDCWLAPFDLSVSQNVQLRALPTEDEGITRIEMRIVRRSGEVSNWRRLNRGFLTLMRKQFLIWRTVPPATKVEYTEQGQERLKGVVGGLKA